MGGEETGEWERIEAEARRQIPKAPYLRALVYPNGDAASQPVGAQSDLLRKARLIWALPRMMQRKNDTSNT